MNEQPSAPTVVAPAPPPARPPRRRRWRALPVIGGLVIVWTATLVIAGQVESRDDFATSELASGVEERWGAPVDQPAPSVRAVPSGTVFTTLEPMALSQQHVTVDAVMNYRKRGLRFFSGFDFAFAGQYAVENPKSSDIDVAFVFPIEVNKAQVLMSDLQFLVDGAPAPMELGAERNRLVWTGRIGARETRRFTIRYRARGLDSFTYRLDPSLPARDVSLHVGVIGGDNFDYPAGVLSASSVTRSGDGLGLDWRFSTLESGVSLGVVLPSLKSWDGVIATMARRAWFPFIALLALLFALGVKHRRPLASYETLLVAAVFGFTFVVVAYLAALVSFEVAWPVAVLGLGAAFTAWMTKLMPDEGWRTFAGLWLATMGLPTLAVVAQGYTGVIYTAELLVGLIGALVLSTRASVRAWLDDGAARQAEVSS
ncbi:MAG: hypothetical protein MUC96_11040 [Myxococcaceae bacterium]|jgi:hypothetical protein|nr:hypothetical protein [Myxococcaceae bacterium]